MAMTNIGTAVSSKKGVSQAPNQSSPLFKIRMGRKILNPIFNNEFSFLMGAPEGLFLDSLIACDLFIILNN